MLLTVFYTFYVTLDPGYQQAQSDSIMAAHGNDDIRIAFGRFDEGFVHRFDRI